MKIRLVVSLIGLAIVLAVPTFAQKDTVDPKIVEQIRALASKYDAALNNHDAAAVAALYTEDGVSGAPHATGHGRQAIEKAYANWFKHWQVGNYFTKVDRVNAVGNEVRSFGTWSDIFRDTSNSPRSDDGHYSWVIVREGDTWKIRRSTFTRTAGGSTNM
jgi:uncharacterized protein (TIGR02246 family)